MRGHDPTPRAPPRRRNVPVVGASSPGVGAVLIGQLDTLSHDARKGVTCVADSVRFRAAHGRRVFVDFQHILRTVQGVIRRTAVKADAAVPEVPRRATVSSATLTAGRSPMSDDNRSDGALVEGGTSSLLGWQGPCPRARFNFLTTAVSPSHQHLEG